jgi:serine/threonine protein kinase/Flp pilus assembly protein TadD
MIGRKVSHYKIVEKLGEGGLGALYRATDQKNKRPVAIRVLPPRLMATRRDRERFIKDAEAASALQHPNVARTFAIEKTDGNTLIVLEDVDGKTLHEKTDLKIDEIIRIVEGVAEGLKAAHEHGLVHQDICSETIVVTARGSAKIVDFGLSRLGVLTPAGPEAQDSLLAYASPELVQGSEVDQRTDLWSLGVLLYELLTGERPFHGDYDAALFYEILNSEPKALRNYRAGIPEHLQILVSKLLEKDPAKRLSSAREVIEHLKPRDGSEADEREYSISVLYFENVSPERENEYVCAGITEDLIRALSKIRGLNVVPRSDVLPFRNRDINTRDLGESLGVDYVLEGNVRKSGGKLRIEAQLSDVASGFPVWHERFDRLTEDIFDLQHEVSVRVAEALKRPISDETRAELSRKPTKDVRAYDFYLRAREFLSQRGKNKAQAAIKMLDNALAIDPDFVLAYTALADAYSSMYTYYDGDHKWLDKIVEVSNKALEYDADLTEARFSVAIVDFHQKKFEEAREVLEEVVAKQPLYYDAYWWLGIISDIMGEYQQALKYYEVAAAIKPYSVEPWLYMNMTHRRKGDVSAAKTSATRFLEVGLKKLEVNPSDAVTLSRFAVIYTLFNEREKAYAALTRILEDQPDDGMVLYNCASTYALLNDKQQSLRCLRTALEHGFRNVLEWIKTDPDFDTIRSSDEFKSLIGEYEGSEE